LSKDPFKISPLFTLALGKDDPIAAFWTWVPVI